MIERLNRGTSSHDPPPGGIGPALAAALPYRTKTAELPPKSISDLKTAVESGRCVTFSVPVYNSWYHSPVVRDTGEITLPIPGEVAKTGHAMCLVGYEDLPGRPELGGGIWILRNSWSDKWGAKCPYGAGYGTIPYIYLSRDIYLSRECMEAFTVA